MKNKLVFASGTLTDANIRGGVSYNHDINPHDDYTVGCASSAEIKFNYDNSNNDVNRYIADGVFDYYIQQANDTDWRLIGKFYITDSEIKRNLVSIKAYDAMIKAEAYIDDFIEAVTFPITIETMFSSLCSYLGVSCGGIQSSLVNETFAVKDNFEAINITGRQVIQYLAEACGGYAVADKSGAICIKDYSTKSVALTNANYVSYTQSNYSVKAIDGLTIRTTSDDIGVSMGATEGNLYIIENNPLFYTESESEISGACNNLYWKIKRMNTYIPAKAELLQDFGLNCGDVFTINGNRFMLMKKEITASGTTFECIGNEERQKQESSLNAEIIALRGKTNQLYRDLEQTKSTLTDTAAGLQSQITQTAEELESKLTDFESDIESTLTQKSNEIDAKITAQDETISEIQMGLDGIGLTYNSANGTASIRIGDITVSGLTTDDYVDRADAEVVAGIDLDGYVRFNDLSTSGSTVINGSNITTGKISADRINMTGSISWSDLDDGVQYEIENAGGGGLDEDEVTTLINSTLVSSPNIAGGKFWDINQENFLKMGTAVGGNIAYLNHYYEGYSSTDPICVMGYMSNGYNDQWVLAPFFHIRLTYLLDDKTMYASGNWDFSQANVTGLNTGGEVTVKAVWGA